MFAGGVGPLTFRSSELFRMGVSHRAEDVRRHSDGPLGLFGWDVFDPTVVPHLPEFNQLAESFAQARRPRPGFDEIAMHG